LDETNIQLSKTDNTVNMTQAAEEQLQPYTLIHDTKYGGM